MSNLEKEIATLQHFADLCYEEYFKASAAHWEHEAINTFNGDFKLAYREI